MSITRLQQARQMYAMGQRVAKTLDGSRPGYRGSDYGDEARGTGGYSGSGDTGDFGSEKANVANTKSAETNLGMDSRDRAIANQYKNLPTPTVTVGVDKFNNPIEIKTTYTDKRNRQKTLDALNAKGISSFDPRITKTGINFLDPNNFLTGFAPKQKQGFNWKGALFNLGLMAINPALAAKYGKAKSIYNAAKYGSKLATDLGLTNTDVVESITSNFTENFGKGKKSTNKSTSTNNTNNGDKGDGDGEGLASLKNQAGNYDEYILLLQKLQSGNISDEERNRFNVLKSKLGI